MNFPFFKRSRDVIVRAPRPPRIKLRSQWVRDPRTGRLVRVWRHADDSERSCTRRPSGPPLPLAA